MTLIFKQREKTEMVGIRLTPQEKAEALKIGSKHGIKVMSTICAALVRYALKAIKEENK